METDKTLFYIELKYSLKDGTTLQFDQLNQYLNFNIRFKWEDYHNETIGGKIRLNTRFCSAEDFERVNYIKYWQFL